MPLYSVNNLIPFNDVELRITIAIIIIVLLVIISLLINFFFCTGLGDHPAPRVTVLRKTESSIPEVKLFFFYF